MLKDSNGKKAKATTHAEKVQVRAAALTRKKTSYAN
jgi:hypothetical protein